MGLKARVKATGEIVEVYQYGKPYYIEYVDEKAGRLFHPEELDFLDDPDYWTRLEHQAAIAAMQSLIMTSTHNFGTSEQIAMWANEYATALVKELKEE